MWGEVEVWGEIDRRPMLAAPGFDNYSGSIASTTLQAIGSETHKVQGLSEKEIKDLCKAYQPLVVKIAARYSGRGIAFEDLKAAGELGLVRALRKFDPDLGFALGAYAQYWIWGEITAPFKPTADAMSAGRAISLETRLDDQKDDDGPRTIADTVADNSEPPDYSPDDIDVSGLTERERIVFLGRIKEGKTLKELGDQLGVSQERVRQIYEKAATKVRRNDIRRIFREDATLRGRCCYKKPSHPLLPLNPRTYSGCVHTQDEIETVVASRPELLVATCQRRAAWNLDFNDRLRFAELAAGAGR
jgi:RNA polymerase sigma factor (sigma-70 family)